MCFKPSLNHSAAYSYKDETGLAFFMISVDFKKCIIVKLVNVSSICLTAYNKVYI